MTYSRWDVVSVEFPFVEGTDSKRRPAVIVSADKLHAEHGTYWVVMVTTAKAGHKLSDIPVSDRKRAGLPEDCVIRVSRITTLSDSRIDRKLGGLSTKDRNAITALLRRYAP